MSFEKVCLGENVTLYRGDCLEVLPTLDCGSMDLVFADPPFNVDKEYSSYKDYREDYHEWCAEWIGGSFRVLRDTGSIYLMTISRHLGFTFGEMEKHGIFISQVIWKNVSGNHHNNKRFWLGYQPILVYGKTENYKFNPLAIRRDPEKENLKVRWGGYRTEPKWQMLDIWDNVPFVYAGAIQHPEAILQDGTKKKAHPCQMPEELSKRAISFSTDENEKILDPFMGSGTTGVSCVQLGRKFVGIEIDPKYFEIAVKRIEQAQRQMIMPLVVNEAVTEVKQGKLTVDSFDGWR